MVINRKIISDVIPTDLFAESVSEMTCPTEKQSEDCVSGLSVPSGQLQQDVGRVL